MTQYVHKEAIAVNDYRLVKLTHAHTLRVAPFPGIQGGPKRPDPVYPSLVTKIKEVIRILGGPGPIFPPLLTEVTEIIETRNIDKHTLNVKIHTVNSVWKVHLCYEKNKLLFCILKLSY